MPDAILPAEPGTLLLDYLGDDEIGVPILVAHPVIGWLHVNAALMHALTFANVTGRAVEFPSGLVQDRQLRTTYANRAMWAAALVSPPPPPAEPEDADPPLDDPRFGLSTRAKNALKLLGAVKLSDLTAIKRLHAEQQRGVTMQTVLLLTDELTKRDLTWAGAPSSGAAWDAQGAEDEDDPADSIL